MSRSRMAGVIIALLTLGVFLTSASASIVSSATLGELHQGVHSLGWWDSNGQLVKWTENPWSYSNTGKQIDPDTITVTAKWDAPDVICVYYQGGIGVRNNEFTDVFWNYDLVTARGHGIKSASMELLTFGTKNNGTINWAEVLEDSGGNKIDDLLVSDITPNMYVDELPGWKPNGYEWMHVRKDLHLAANGGEAFLSDWKQCYDQVPEASTLLFFGLGVLGAFGLRRRSRQA